MSSENSPVDTDETVLRYRAPGPSVAIPEHPSAEELAFDWTLSAKDKALALQHRGGQNLCRFAVQLCVFRKQGRFLSDYSTVPPVVLGYLCQQLEMEALILLEKADRRNTESDTKQEITAYLNWQPFDERASKTLYRWVLDQVSEQLYVENLFAKVEAFLRESRIVIPGPTVLEREVNMACRIAEQTVWAKLAAHVPETMRSAMDQLMTVSDPSGKSDFFRFAEYPPEARAKKIVEFVTRHEELAALKLETIQLQQVNPKLLRKLAAVVRTYDVWRLKRFEPNKKYALALSFLWDAKQSLLDYLVEMHAQFMTEMERSANLAWEEEHRSLRKRLKVGVVLLRKFGSEALALKDPEMTTVGRLFEAVPADQVQSAIADCAAFEELEKDGFLRKLHARYSNFRRYFPYFANLNFAADAGGEAIVSGLKLLCRLEQGELKALPEDVDVSFVRESWRQGLSHGRTDGIDRTTWEISLALALSDGLRSGRVYLPESRHYVSFWDLCYDDTRWQQEKPRAYLDLELPTDGAVAIRKLVEEFHKAATAADVHLATNPFAKVVDGRLVVKRETAVAHPEGTAEFGQRVERHLSQIRIERLVEEVDWRCGFIRHLKPPGQDALDTPEHKKILRAAITAHATNLGIFGMVGCTQGITVDQLQRVSRACLYKEASTARMWSSSTTFAPSSTVAISEKAHAPLRMVNALASGQFAPLGLLSSVFWLLRPCRHGLHACFPVRRHQHASDFVLTEGSPLRARWLLENDTDLDLGNTSPTRTASPSNFSGFAICWGFPSCRGSRISSGKSSTTLDDQKHGKVDSLFRGTVD